MRRGGGGEFRTNCIVRGGITIARGGITSFNFVFRIFSNLLATFSFFFFFLQKKIHVHIHSYNNDNGEILIKFL